MSEYAPATCGDRIAGVCDTRRRERWPGWDRRPFTGASTMHVSVYGREEQA